MGRPRKSNSVTITEAMAKPQSPKEMGVAVESFANALDGTYGTGEWDGGVEGASGFWHRYSQYWDAKLVVTISTSQLIVFPFTVIDSLLRLTKLDGTSSIIYIENAKQLNVAGNGKYVLELFFVKNTKEL